MLEGSLKERDASGLERLARMAGSVAGAELDSLTFEAEGQTPNRLLSITDRLNQPLHSAISRPGAASVTGCWQTEEVAGRALNDVPHSVPMHWACSLGPL